MFDLRGGVQGLGGGVDGRSMIGGGLGDLRLLALCFCLPFTAARRSRVGEVGMGVLCLFRLAALGWSFGDDRGSDDRLSRVILGSNASIGGSEASHCPKSASESATSGRLRLRDLDSPFSAESGSSDDCVSEGREGLEGDPLSGESSGTHDDGGSSSDCVGGLDGESLIAGDDSFSGEDGGNTGYIS